MDLELQEALERAWESVGGWIEAAIAGLPNLVAAAVILAVFWLLARGARTLVARLLDRVSNHRAVNRLLSTILYVGVLAVGLLVALGVMNLDRTVTTLLASAGILGLALGFAAQDSAENLIAGIMLSVRRPFKEGELISTGDTFGTVEEINLRATVLRTPTGQLVYTPNKDVFGNTLTNYSALGSRRVDVSCGVGYADDLEKAERVVKEALEGLEGRDDSREVEVFFEEFGGSSINFVARFWIPYERSNKVYLSARSRAIRRIKAAFDEHGVSIPFPIRTLDFGIAGGSPLAEQLSASSDVRDR